MAERDAPPIRPRLLAVAVLVAVVAASGLALERLVDVREPTQRSADGAPSGAWFCPHGGSRGWRAWVAITNPGDAPVRVRVTSHARSGVQEVGWLTVGPLRQVYREVRAAEPSASTSIEYFGGWVGAAAVLQATREEGAVAATRCASSSRPTWYLLDQPTGRRETAYLVVMNPFAADAQFDVVIRTEQRTIQPGSLTPYVLPPRASVAIRMNEFALEAPGEPTVTAEVIRRTGRIVAGGVGVAPEGIRAEVGSTTAHERWLAPAPGVAGEARVILLDPGDVPVDLSLLSVEATGQRVLSGPEGLSVAPGSAASYPVQDLGDGGMLVEVAGQAGVVPSLVLTDEASDTASIGLVAGAAGRRWLVLPSTPPEGGRQLLLIQNPGDEPAEVTLQLIGTLGPVPAPANLGVAAGGFLLIEVSSFTGGLPVSVMVRVSSGSVVAAGAASAADGSGYAATLGIPAPSQN